MVTRSFIARVREDDKAEGIYCHFDGCLKGVGNMLFSNYKDAEKVKRLIALGYLLTLGEKVDPDPTKPHSFEGRYRETGYQEDVCLAYGRDGGKTGVGAFVGTLEECIARFNESWEEYFYLFENGVWKYLKNGTFVELTEDII